MNNNHNSVVVYGGFDNIMSQDIRFLQEASRCGLLNVFLWNDEFIRSVTGKEPKFPESERIYFLESIRYVNKVFKVNQPSNGSDFSLIKKFQNSIKIVL